MVAAAHVFAYGAAGYGDRLEPRAWDLERFRREHLGAYLARCRAGRVAEEFEG